MKKILVLILSLFLLTTVSCVTTEQNVAETEEPAKEAEEAADTGPVDYDLSGTWTMTEVTKGCGTKKTTQSTKVGHTAAKHPAEFSQLPEQL